MSDAKYLGLTANKLARIASDLDAENARLRELVRDLYQCSRQCGCDRCGYKDGCAMFGRMAQMGVKVEA